jgi:hypothetical protein
MAKHRKDRKINQNKSLVKTTYRKEYCMTITIGWDDAFQHYSVELYVNGLRKVTLYARQAMEVIYTIQMMKQVHPIHIGWHHSIKSAKKAQMIQLMQAHITA